MTIRRYEIQTTVHAIVLNVLSVQSALVGKVLPKLFVNVRRAHAPTLLAIDGVAKAGRVDDGQAQSDALLLDVHRFAFDASRFLDAFVRIGHRSAAIQVAQEQAVHHGRFAETRLANDHQCELEAALHRFAVHLLGQRGEPDVVAVTIEAAADTCEQFELYVY